MTTMAAIVTISRKVSCPRDCKIRNKTTLQHIMAPSGLLSLEVSVDRWCKKAKNCQVCKNDQNSSKNGKINRATGNSVG